MIQPSSEQKEGSGEKYKKNSRGEVDSPPLTRATARQGGREKKSRQTMINKARDCPSSSVPVNNIRILTSPPCSRPETPHALAVAPGPSGSFDLFDPSVSAATEAVLVAVAVAVAASSRARTSPSAGPSSSSPPSPRRGQSSPCALCPSYPGPRTCTCPAPRLVPSAMVQCRTLSLTRCAALYDIASSGCIFFSSLFYAVLVSERRQQVRAEGSLQLLRGNLL